MFNFLKSKKKKDTEQKQPDKAEKAFQEEKAPVKEPSQAKGLFANLRRGLKRTRTNLGQGIGNLLLGKKTIDEEVLEAIETQLLMADVGVEATQQIIAGLTERVSRKQLADPQTLFRVLKEDLFHLLEPCCQTLQVTAAQQPFVILMVGVNGTGKTTTIGKLAKRLQQQGKKVMLAAGDTFRAAATEQLQIWGDRNNIPVVAQQAGADSAAVVFDALQAAIARKADVLIADTAGRLHTQTNLMEELKKIKRVIQKLDPSAPHEVMIVVDAGTGQNALQQARQFHEAVGVTGITLTKLDGTAKGGIIFAIAKKMGLPIRFIGMGEAIDDLQPFDPENFIAALFDEEQQ